MKTYPLFMRQTRPKKSDIVPHYFKFQKVDADRLERMAKLRGVSKTQILVELMGVAESAQEAIALQEKAAKKVSMDELAKAVVAALSKKAKL